MAHMGLGFYGRDLARCKSPAFVPCFLFELIGLQDVMSCMSCVIQL